MNSYISPIIIGFAIVVGSWLVATNINHTSVITSEQSNNLSVSGDGKAFAKPDTFIVTVLAEEKSKNTKDGFALVNTKIAQIKKALLDNGIAEKDIQSNNISINPNYVYDNGKSTIDGFIASHGLTVKIRNLENVDTILSSVSTIANLQIQSTSYDIDDKTPLYKTARELAIAKARQKAEDMAKASGITLGRILSINESQGYAQPMSNQYYARAEMDSVAPGSGISAGELEISTTVSITYEIR
ncbi:SIMPL domain-containing protein [Candidatus Gracilibacteria bacterium]|nr:SIMPL domain-containing protein [Candidatus Gracilibacteria bacterium]